MGSLEEKIIYENLRNQVRSAYSLCLVKKSLSELRSITSHPGRSPWKNEKRIYDSSSLRRSNRLKGVVQVSYCDSRRRPRRMNRKNVDSIASLGGDSRKIRKLVAKESKETAIVPHVKEGDLKKRLSPAALTRQCGSKGEGSAYDPSFGICCCFCSSLDDLLCLNKRMMDQTKITTFRDNEDADLRAHVLQTTPKEGWTHGGEGSTHELESSTHWLKIEEASVDTGQPIGITKSDMGSGSDKTDFSGAAERLISLASPLPRTSRPLCEAAAAIGKLTEQQKHDPEEIANRLEALEQSVVHNMEEMKQHVHSSCVTLKQEMRTLFIKALEDFQGRSITNLIQNYELIDVHVGRLEQNITRHGSDLKREVSQMKMSWTQKNSESSE